MPEFRHFKKGKIWIMIEEKIKKYRSSKFKQNLSFKAA